MNIMKKIWLAGLLLAAGISWTAAADEAEKIVPPGTFPNLLSNGNLELYAGDFPGFWRAVGEKPQYRTTGAPDGGGRFIFNEKKINYRVRQDWTFSIEPGERFRVRAKIRARGFRADRAVLMVVNNGWKKTVACKIPQGNYDWKDIELVFTGFESIGNNYSAVINVRGIRQGSLESANIAVEAATEKANAKSLEFLRSIPSPELVPVSPRLKRIPGSNAVLHCRWFGERGAKIEYFVDDRKHGETQAADNGNVTLDLAGVTVGKHTLKAASGNYSVQFEIAIQEGFESPAGNRKLNNFHVVIAEIDLHSRKSLEFTNPHDGWVLFRLPENIRLEGAGLKRPLRNGDFVWLPFGKKDLKVLGTGSGTAVISRVTGTGIYPLGADGRFPDLNRHDWQFIQKHQLPWAMNFYGGRLPALEMQLFRQGNHRFMELFKISRIANAKDDGTPITAKSLERGNPDADGIAIDELALGSLKGVVAYLKNLPRLQMADDRSILTWVCGCRVIQPGAKYVAEVLSACINLTADSFFGMELYLPNNHTDPGKVRKQIEENLIGSLDRAEKLCPGIMQYGAVTLCSSNLATLFTIDNEPEADFRVLLDLQMQALATTGTIDFLGNLIFWGDNYADLECSRWVMRLIRHYVFEGKTPLLSDELGLRLCPGHVRNASFREGLAHYQAEGSVKPGTSTGFISRLKRFNPERNDDHCAVFTRNKQANRLSQKIRNLIPGKCYKLKYVTLNGPLALKIDNGKILDGSRLFIRQKPGEKKFYQADYSEVIFQADAAEAVVTFSDENAGPGQISSLHYLSVFRMVDR